MKRALPVLAAVAAISAVVAIGQGADAQIQRGSGSFQTQPNTANPDNRLPHNAQPTNQGGVGGFKTSPTNCLPGWTQVELKLDTSGNLSRMTCQSPIIDCPTGHPNYSVGLEVVKQPVHIEDGRYRLQYRCQYFAPAG
ncbi:hypothetical protein [Pelagibius sp.]|uniref:hypothetical protein n=1 Tax=Pelagibius sp. TaxID=1931238 RepID=UPI003BB08297